METMKLTVDGMGCGGCVKNVRKVLDGLPGVTVASVAIGSAVVGLDAGRTSRQSVMEALTKAGYPSREAGSVASEVGGIPPGRETTAGSVSETGRS